MNIDSIVLEGIIVRLEPLLLAHVTALADVGLDPTLWRLQPRPVRSLSDMRGYVESALTDQKNLTSVPFVIVQRENDMIIGSTRFMDVEPKHRRVEIGATWLNPAYQRTGANVEAKLLMLTHAFEVMHVQKVVFKTEASNAQSKRAILALGAVEEGTLRRHLLSDAGRPRDMTYFSILESEWPDARDRIQARLLRHR